MNLKGKTIQGGIVTIGIQPVKFTLRIISMVILARILIPDDFGVVGMVTAVIGVLGLFKDMGLSSASIQRSTITHEQISTLFWINLTIGGVLAVLAISIAPVLVSFYREPRLYWITIAIGGGLLFDAGSTQHQALLLRQMRYVALAGIDILSLMLSIAVGIAMAIFGFGYWSLVGMTLSQPITSAVFIWVTAAWVPGRPQMNIGIRSMLHFGGTITLNNLVSYLTYNAEKILLGRFWGTEVLGIYGRAYQLINLPTEQLNSAIGKVAFPALSRLQDDHARFRTYFVKGYSLVLAMTIPITLACAMFADDIIYVFLGPKWNAAAAIFRYLAPTILAFALINPFGWLLMARGLVRRSLIMALVIAPLVIAAYGVGLSHGPVGVAIGYSAMMTLLVVPMIAWAKHGMPISSMDILGAASRPILAGIVAGALAFGAQFYCGHLLSSLPRLVLVCVVLFSSYLFMLMYGMGQKNFYMGLLQELKSRTSVMEQKEAAG